MTYFTHCVPLLHQINFLLKPDDFITFLFHFANFVKHFIDHIHTAAILLVGWEQGREEPPNKQLMSVMANANIGVSILREQTVFLLATNNVYPTFLLANNAS